MFFVFQVLCLSVTEVSNFGFETHLIQPNDSLVFNMNAKFKSFIIFDLHVSNTLMISFDGVNNMTFNNGQVFAFSITENCKLTNTRNTTQNTAIYTLQEGICDTAKVFLGQPYANATITGDSENFCIFSPNSDYLVEAYSNLVNGDGDATLYTFPLSDSKNISTNTLAERITSPYFLKYKSSSKDYKIDFGKIYNGGIEWTWNRCMIKSFGSASKSELINPKDTSEFPYCYKPHPPIGFTRHDGDILGVTVPALILGIIIPYLAICGVFDPLINLIRTKYFQNLDGTDDLEQNDASKELVLPPESSAYADTQYIRQDS